MVNQEPLYTTQNVEHSISQTFTKLGQFYQTIIDNYLLRVETSELIESFPQSIENSIQSQISLQAFTVQEVLNDEVFSQIQQKWNFFVSYEKKLLYNLVALQDAIRSENSNQIA